MKLSSFAGILWVAGFIFDCVLLAVLCIRRRGKNLPIFCTFITFGAVRSLILFWLWRHAQWNLYRTSYFTFMVFDTCLQFGLIWEIASRVFRRRGVWAPDVRGKLLSWTIASVALASVLVAIQKPAGNSWMQGAVLRSNLFPSVLLCELFIVMLILSSEAGLNWRTHVASITVGLALYNFPAIIIFTLDNLRGFDGHGYLSGALENARKGFYLACLAYWCYALWRPEPKPRTMSPDMEGQVSAIRDVLMRRLHNWSKE
jgi:hypothetical protein